MAARIEMYVKAYCPFCSAAKRLLDGKGVEAEITDLMKNPAKRGEMIQRSKGRTTVPQIFVDGRHVGGFDDLAALDGDGALDPILKTGA